MTPAPTEKAAPIPADVLTLAEEFVAKLAGLSLLNAAWRNRDPSVTKRDFRTCIARAIMQDRADRASQEERTREDERDRLLEIAYTNGKFLRPVHDQAIRQFLTLQRAMLPADRARLRGDAS